MSNARFESRCHRFIVLARACHRSFRPGHKPRGCPRCGCTDRLPRRAVNDPRNSPAEINAEREKIWNSSDMLCARAWLKDYCSKSAKVTPEMAKQYETELANMSPNQLRLWLLKFDEDEQQRQQQYAMFQQQNAAGLQQAMATHKQTQQAYSALNQAGTAAAQCDSKI